MYRTLNYSVFLSNYEKIKKDLLPADKLSVGVNPYIFTSLHITEENDSEYPVKIKKMCEEISSFGYQIIADVSPKTLELLNEKDIFEVAQKYHLNILRLDFGFSLEEQIEIAKKIPICLNASTLNQKEAEVILKSGGSLYAMHNYYPRPETGLDNNLFSEINQRLKKLGIPIMAFIAGDIYQRGPIYEGLPTLESHRRISPYTAYLDMVRSYQIENVYVGDGVVSKKEKEMIENFRMNGELYIPIQRNNKEYDRLLFNKKYTIRQDSPSWTKRLIESRQYASQGSKIQIEPVLPRNRGSITIDNQNYKRYSGEMQIIIEDLPADKRVNVIARIPEKYQLLLSIIKNGDVIRFTKA